MNEEIQNALIGLEGSLTEVKSAVDLINETKGSAAGVIDKAAETIESVKQQMEELQLYFEKWINELDEQTKKLFGEYEGLWEKQNDEVQKLFKQNKELIKEVAELVKYLNSVNFPARLDKIDSTIATVLNGNQTIQNQLNELSRRLADNTEKLRNQITENSKYLRILKPLVIVISVIALISLIFNVLSYFN